LTEPGSMQISILPRHRAYKNFAFGNVLHLKIPLERVVFARVLLLQIPQHRLRPALKKLERLNYRIAYTDDKINKLVYDLYGLTEEEVLIMEGRVKGLIFFGPRFQP
jgi:hypothetical protein